MDRVEISNLALSKLGEDDQLIDPDDDTKPARSIKAVWNSVRDAVLRRHLWNFAMKRALLSRLVAAPAFGFAHQYQLPDDFIRLDIDELDTNVLRKWSLEGSRRLLCDATGPIEVRYVARIAETGDWDALFVEAFACRLAFQVCDRLTGDRGRKQDCWSSYVSAIREATGVDGRENPPVDMMDSSWVTARHEGGPSYPGSYPG
ncbi:MAG: hypothetical protein LCH74_20220 [Proteobacteria bacterium]|nr:hypothetical protein [Pseudomonadota bacterium]